MNRLFICAVLLSLVLITAGCRKKDIGNETFFNDENVGETSLFNDTQEFYQVVCNYGNDGHKTISEFFNSSNSLQLLKEFNKNMKDTFAWTEFNFQPLYSIGFYSGSPKFVASYNEVTDSAETINQNAGSIEGTPLYVTDLKTMQVDKKISALYDDFIEKGRNLSESDFIVNGSDDTISVILGHEYMKQYAIGDILNLSLHQKNMKFKVVGFYKENMSITVNGKEINLDYNIVMPFYDINYVSEDEVDERYQKIYYSQKNEGYIAANGETFNKLNLQLNELIGDDDLAYILTNFPLNIEK